MNPSRLRRAAVSALSAALAAAVPTPAAGAPASRWADLRVDAFDRLEGVERLVASGSLADAVRAAAGLAGIEVGALKTPPAREAPPHTPGPGAPAAIAEPVGRLLGAIEATGALARAALKADAGSLRRLSGAIERARADAADPRAAARFRELQRQTSRAIDQTAVFLATLALARAIDEAVPALRAHASALPRSPAAVVGCDLVDQPSLCIGGTGPNTYEIDYPLLIDLGGDDLHANSAGGADAGALDGLGNHLNVAVTIDVGGADRYQASLPTASGARVVQGAGLAGGIGFLVDLGGDDVYSAVSGPAGASAQGQGFGAVGGAGVIADAGGNDSYRLIDTVPGTSQGATGLAYGAVGAVGIALDVGGDDAYIVQARPSGTLTDGDGVVHPGRTVATGFGFAAAGTALFADSGGADSLTLDAATFPIPSQDPSTLAETYAEAAGHGYAIIGGQAASVFGPGATARSSTAETSAPVVGAASINAYGVGLTAGYGALLDAGGDDTYLARATASASHEAAAGDACTCHGVAARAETLGATVRAAGHAILGAMGVLRDAGGNDRYTSTSVSIAEARARDERTVLPPPPAEPPPVEGADARATAAGAFTATQGWGAIGGAGFIEDAGGNDLYTSTVTVEARATATATLENVPRLARAESGGAASHAQAYGAEQGYGELRDLAGSDTYTTANASSAVGEPASEGSEVSGSAASVVQGAVEGAGAALLVDADGGTSAADSFTASPERSACLGTRGQGVWQDCGTGAGGGANA